MSLAPCFLVIDKPPGVTSHDIVAAVRAVTGVKKVGHTGTLDPFATGVLPLALGPATRLIQYLDESEKVYDATIALGAETDTGDPTGVVTVEKPVPTLTDEVVEETLATFVGERMQVPPAYSAVKKDGKPLYKYARKGQKVEVAARPITLYGVDLIRRDETHIRIRITCSRGTYARVLASEIAQALGTAGHLSALCRERSGPFVLEGALDLPTLGTLASDADRPWKDVLMGRGKKAERVPWRTRDEVRDSLAPYRTKLLDALSHLRLSDVDGEAAKRVRSGGALPAPPAGVAFGDRYLIVQENRLVAIAEHDASGGKAVRVVSS